ncbi:MAG TPA: hypothetical protein VFM48_05095 [Aquabacterium sp.]|nr:hypothetical protein [Aquabacterium sp.]
MASEVDICNLALAHLGDEATVASINPPEGSAQASHCARFYPIARDGLLEMHIWGFASKRAALALVGTYVTSTWKYAYAAPSDVVNYVAILDPDAQDDYSVGLQMSNTGIYAAPVRNLGVYTPQQFAVEADDNGNDIIYTNVENAVLRYSHIVTDTTKFSPLFVTTLSHYLASMLAGPLLKGDVGRQVAEEQLKLAAAMQARAEGSDANQRNIKPAMGASWMVNR